jgi:hypothetical protein
MISPVVDTPVCFGRYQSGAVLLRLTHIRVTLRDNPPLPIPLQGIFLRCVVAPTTVPTSGWPDPIALPEIPDGQITSGWVPINPIRWVWFAAPGAHLYLYSGDVQFLVSTAYIENSVAIAAETPGSTPKRVTAMTVQIAELDLGFDIELGYEVNNNLGGVIEVFIRNFIALLVNTVSSFVAIASAPSNNFDQLTEELQRRPDDQGPQIG